MTILNILLVILAITGISIIWVIRILYDKNRFIRGFVYSLINKKFFMELKSTSKYELEISIKPDMLRTIANSHSRVTKTYSIRNNYIEVLYEDVHTPIRIMVTPVPLHEGEEITGMGSEIIVELMGREELGYRNLIKSPIFSRFENLIKDIETSLEIKSVFNNNSCKFMSIIKEESWEKNISKHDKKLDIQVDITKNVLSLNSRHFSGLITGAKEYIPTPF